MTPEAPAREADTLAFETQEGLLLVRYRGLFALPDLLQAGTAIYAACDEAAATSVLVDLRAAEDHGMSVPDRYQFLNWMATGGRPELRVAIVLRTDQGLPGVRWTEAAAQRGLRVRVFTRPAAGREWLSLPDRAVG